MNTKNLQGLKMHQKRKLKPAFDVVKFNREYSQVYQTLLLYLENHNLPINGSNHINHITFLKSIKSYIPIDPLKAQEKIVRLLK